MIKLNLFRVGAPKAEIISLHYYSSMDRDVFPKEDRRQLLPFFKEDMKSLQDIIDNDISAWF